MSFFRGGGRAEGAQRERRRRAARKGRGARGRRVCGGDYRLRCFHQPSHFAAIRHAAFFIRLYAPGAKSVRQQNAPRIPLREAAKVVRCAVFHAGAR